MFVFSSCRLFASAHQRFDVPKTNYVHSHYPAEILQICKIFQGDLDLPRDLPIFRDAQLDVASVAKCFRESEVVLVEISSRKMAKKGDVFINLLNGVAVKNENTEAELVQLYQYLLKIGKKKVVFSTHYSSNDTEIVAREWLDNVVIKHIPPEMRLIPKEQYKGFSDDRIFVNDGKDFNHVTPTAIKLIGRRLLHLCSESPNWKISVGVIGVGVVGTAWSRVLEKFSFSVLKYDKYKPNVSNCTSIAEMATCDVVFLCLPTLYDADRKTYNTDSMMEVLEELSQLPEFDAEVVIKSTVTPTTTSTLQNTYPGLKFVHNPEFLTARRAYPDMLVQEHVVIGQAKFPPVLTTMLFKRMFPEAKVTHASSTCTEMLKIACNSFYAVKVQFFNELFQLCVRLDTNYDHLVEGMLRNNWINPMHTQVPGPDGNISYGGMCLIKDSNALNQFCISNKSPNLVLNASCDEQKMMRPNEDPVWPPKLGPLQVHICGENTEQREKLSKMLPFTITDSDFEADIVVKLHPEQKELFSLDTFYRLCLFKRTQLPCDPNVQYRPSVRKSPSQDCPLVNGFKVHLTQEPLHFVWFKRRPCWSESAPSVYGVV